MPRSTEEANFRTESLKELRAQHTELVIAKQQLEEKVLFENGTAEDQALLEQTVALLSQVKESMYALL